MSHHHFSRVLLLLISITLFGSATPAADGDFDLTFNFVGFRFFDCGPGELLKDIAVQPDGKIVSLTAINDGTTGYKFALYRLNRDGSTDNSFGSSGLLIPQFPAEALQRYPHAIAVQPDGRILAAGRYVDAAGENMLLIRLNANGTWDSSFGTSGRVVLDFSGAFDEARALSIQPDGKIVIAGISIGPTGDEFAVARYNSDGTPDTSFDSDGRVVTVQIGVNQVNAVAIQPDGKIVAGGTTGANQASIVRYNANGSLDPSFSGDGIVSLTFGTASEINSLRIQWDGKIVLGGFIDEGSGRDFLLVRLNSDGSLDPSFGTGGKVVTPIGPAENEAAKIALQPDGKIVAAGFASNGSNIDYAVARYNPNGTLDASQLFGSETSLFGSGGIVTSSFGQSDYGASVAIQPDGAILVGGYNTSSVIARYSSVRPKLFDYDGDGKSDISIFRPSNGQWWLNRSTAGTIAHTFGNSTDRIVPADYTGDGKTDVAIYRPGSGEWFILRSEDYSFYSFPFGVSTDRAAPADYDGDGKADAAVFRASNGTWYIQRSSGGTTIQGFGTSGDFPVPADYDGDGKADIAIFRPSLGQWWLMRSTAGTIAATFGISGDKPVQGDYTGDGKADIAFFRTVTGEWFVLRSENSTFYSFPFGINGDAPAPADYDGDGRFDAAVFRSNDTNWYISRSTQGLLIQQFGALGDRPTPMAFVP